MNANDEIIIELSRKLLSDTPFNKVYDDEAWVSAFEKAQEQNITALMASVILELPKELQPKNVADWQRVLIQTVYAMGKKNAEFERVVKLLSDDGIIPLCLKGTVIKNLYPVPELRTMGDFDILIDESERNKAEILLAKNGYTVNKDTLFSEVAKDGVNGELFCSLEEEFRNDTEYWNKKIRENTYLYEGRLLLTQSYEFAYSVIHAAKHITEAGCGIRNLFDVVVLLQNRENIDFNLVEEICKAQGYEKVLYYMITASEYWYGIEVNSNITRMNIDDTELFIEYLLSYGVFGMKSKENILATQIIKHGGENVNIFRRLFFPPRVMLCRKYQYLKKLPLLLPVAWIQRFITAVFIKKYSIKDMVMGIDESIDYGKDRDKWLNDLGLK
jgi:hypothetical protein